MVCMPVEKLVLHQKFTVWPLHLTLLSWFEISNFTLPQLLSNIELTIRKYEPIQIKGSTVAYFGPSKNIKVRLLDAEKELYSFRQEFAQQITSSHISLNKNNQTFQPHITFNSSNKSINKNETLFLSNLSLITKINNNHQYQVVEQYNLKKA